MERIK